ncbi:MAG: hypothetical protein RL038_109 [Actinomycetota bacterium]|jgi:FtsZ-interacting cell division protein YlmF
MSKFRKLGQFLGLVDEYDYDPEGRYNELLTPPAGRADTAAQPVVSQSASRPTAVPNREGVRLIPTEDTQAQVVPLHQPEVEISKQIKFITPMIFNDAEKIGVDFRNGHPVMINLHETTPELSRRLIDFLSGVVLALNGRMQKASAGVIMILPHGYEISAMQKEELNSGHFFNQG